MSDLTPETQEKLDALVKALDKMQRRRRVMLIGYCLAAVGLIVGMVLAIFLFAASPPGKFVGWVFFIPFTIVGTVLWIFGKWAARVK